jgi:DNA (cytosine-5)-methyltransferase 1
MTDLAACAQYQSTQEELTDLESKLFRLRRGGPPRVIDLFSGCGGMSLGLHKAGYSLLGGVEINPKANNTHARNFFSRCDEETFDKHNTPHDISTFTPELFMREILHEENPGNLVDVIVGGPPCQAFARVGRAKLRQVRNMPDAYLKDDRANLYIPYLLYVEFFRPLAVIMENVPDIMNYGGRNVAEEIACTLEEIGYRCHYTILNTANYGVPQMRQRFYLIALLDALDIDPYFPRPTHFAEIPAGYDRVRTTALSEISLKNQQLKPFDPTTTHYIKPPDVSEELLPAVTSYGALSDLPEISFHLNMGTGRGLVRSFETLIPYRNIEPSEYARALRTWPDFSSFVGVKDHVIRLLPRDYPIFRRMRPGDEYPKAHALAQQIFHEKLREEEAKTGRVIAEDSEEYNVLWKKTVPPYNPKKFPNKWWKLIPDQPSRTLTAHMGKDTYSHIHYSDEQARVISVREAARLQSFPDGFEFTGPMNAAYTQIGNAVSPIQAYAFGIHIKQLLQEVARQSAQYEVLSAICRQDVDNQSELAGSV